MKCVQGSHCLNQDSCATSALRVHVACLTKSRVCCCFCEVVTARPVDMYRKHLNHGASVERSALKQEYMLWIDKRHCQVQKLLTARASEMRVRYVIGMCNRTKQ